MQACEVQPSFFVHRINLLCWQHFFFARNNDRAVGAYVKFEEIETDLNESTCEIMFRRRLDSQRSSHLATGNGRLLDHDIGIAY